MTQEKHGHGSERLDERQRVVVLAVSSTPGTWSQEEVCEKTVEYGGRECGDEMSVEEKRILFKIVDPSPELPFPLRVLEMAHGRPALEYVIPDEAREYVFRELYPFVDVPDLDEERFDLHEERLFCIRDYKVIREAGRNLLVSPYYAHSGGMVVDWICEGDYISAQVIVNQMPKKGAADCDTCDDGEDSPEA